MVQDFAPLFAESSNESDHRGLFFVMRYDIFFFEGDSNVTVRKRGWSAITVGKRVQKYKKINK